MTRSAAVFYGEVDEDEFDEDLVPTQPIDQPPPLQPSISGRQQPTSYSSSRKRGVGASNMTLNADSMADNDEMNDSYDESGSSNFAAQLQNPSLLAQFMWDPNSVPPHTMRKYQYKMQINGAQNDTSSNPTGSAFSNIVLPPDFCSAFCLQTSNSEQFSKSALSSSGGASSFQNGGRKSGAGFAGSSSMGSQRRRRLKDPVNPRAWAESDPDYPLGSSKLQDLAEACMIHYQKETPTEKDVLPWFVYKIKNREKFLKLEPTYKRDVKLESQPDSQDMMVDDRKDDTGFVDTENHP